jgi:nitroreductase
MLEIIGKRRSIRKFLPKDVEQEKIDEILKAAMFSPSAMNSRPWEFIVVRDQELKNKISKATQWIGFVKDAPVLLVIAGKEGRILPSLWIEDCSIAAENVYLEAANQKLGTCFCQITGSKTLTIAGKDSEEYIRKVLDIPKGIRVLCVMPIGYPNEKKEEHKESEFDIKKVHNDKY